MFCLAGWRLTPYPAYWFNACSALPDGGWCLIRPTGSAHVLPCRMAAGALSGLLVQRMFSLAGWRLAPYPAYWFNACSALPDGG